jgi:hypothetical protein
MAMKYIFESQTVHAKSPTIQNYKICMFSVFSLKMSFARLLLSHQTLISLIWYVSCIYCIHNAEYA